MKKLLVVIFVFVFAFSIVNGQSVEEVREISKIEFLNPEFNKRNVEYIFKHNKNVLVKYNPLSLFFGGLMYVYQKHISPALGSSCPYQLSCSAFSVSVIKKYGLIKGVFLSADRLTRCTPTAARDIDESNLDSVTNKILDPLEDYK
jgi:putative component of membrane protein insertase Oxa1/YidC/SpoIIIJ protein YidD